MGYEGMAVDTKSFEIGQVNFDPSQTDVSNWAEMKIFKKYSIKLPADWFPKKGTEEENAISYGSGISSFLTIRDYPVQDALEKRMAEYENDGRKFEKEIVVIGNKKYTRYYVFGKSLSADDSIGGFFDWFVPAEESTLVFSSDDDISGQDEKIIAVIISSLKTME